MQTSKWRCSQFIVLLISKIRNSGFKTEKSHVWGPCANNWLVIPSNRKLMNAALQCVLNYPTLLISPRSILHFLHLWLSVLSAPLSFYSSSEPILATADWKYNVTDMLLIKCSRKEWTISQNMHRINHLYLFFRRYEHIHADEWMCCRHLLTFRGQSCRYYSVRDSWRCQSTV